MGGLVVFLFMLIISGLFPFLYICLKLFFFRLKTISTVATYLLLLVFCLCCLDKAKSKQKRSKNRSLHREKEIASYMPVCLSACLSVYMYVQYMEFGKKKRNENEHVLCNVCVRYIKTSGT